MAVVMVSKALKIDVEKFPAAITTPKVT